MLSIDDFQSRLAARLTPLDRLGEAPVRSERDLEPHGADASPLTPAAVLAPIVRRPGGWTMLLTQRAAAMPTHAGQVAFPGGRIQAEDDGPLAAALRETHEEIGLTREWITPLGGGDLYETGSGFRITPIIAFVEPGFALNPDPREVDAVFETPLAFLMNPANHERRETFWRGAMRSYYAMPYDNRFIWGATAAMIRALYERLYE